MLHVSTAGTSPEQPVARTVTVPNDVLAPGEVPPQKNQGGA